MLKTISADQLKVGMYIHELDCSWIDHPFARNQFKISDPSDIKKISAAGIKTLKIDTEKGLDVTAPAANQPDIVQTENAKNSNTSKAPASARPNLAKTRNKAKDIKSLAEKAITNIMADVKLGQQVEMELVTPVVDKMADSVLENHNALLGLSRIRHMDKYTFEHSVNIGVLMMSFAKSRGMSEKTIHDVGVGGLLHDIGKTLTPPEILNKPGKLTDEEFIIMRRHVVDSRIILEKTPGINQTALDVAALHHEKFDGSGYPNGVKGDEISEIGLMSAIVDVYDALTADRCYHKGQDPSVVLKRMLSWAGCHFKPQLVQEFIHCVGIYPPATLVMLSNKYLAVVIENNDNLLLPRVVAFLNTRTRETIEPQIIDLSEQSKLKIDSSESDKDWKVDPQKYLDLL
jgi:HD-GYP domain-containing protein (c-di-GMP phosphodiesterase class II)